MNESFIHFLWKFRLLGQEMKTSNGNMVIVFHPGTHNHNAGPDFFNDTLFYTECGLLDIRIR